jgi:hypothetical protein
VACAAAGELGLAAGGLLLLLLGWASRGKGLREIGFRFWDFRDLGKRLQTNRIQI